MGAKQKSILHHPKPAGVEYDNYKSNLKCRTKELIAARLLVAVYLRSNTRMSLGRIGAVIEKDHANVLHLCRNHTDFLDSNDDVHMEMLTIFEKELRRRNPNFFTEMKRFEKKIRN